MILALSLSLMSAQAVDISACKGVAPLQVDLVELNENVAAYVGRCVTVSGPTRASALVGPGEAIEDGLPRYRLGVYEREPYSWRALRKEEGEIWELTGVVDSCEAISRQVFAKHDKDVAEARAAGRLVPALPMLGGACHYHGGPVIWVTSHRRLNSHD